MDFYIPIPSHSHAVNFHSFPFQFPSLRLILIPMGFPLRYSHSHPIPKHGSHSQYFENPIKYFLQLPVSLKCCATGTLSTRMWLNFSQTSDVPAETFTHGNASYSHSHVRVLFSFQLDFHSYRESHSNVYILTISFKRSHL